MISIHPPREGWDFKHLLAALHIHISIHPPREGWDLPEGKACILYRDFNPPTP